MATNYGIDTYCLTDTGLVDVLVTDPRMLIGQRLVRALTMDRGALAIIGGDPNRGFNVRQLVNAKMTNSQQLFYQQQINAECVKDEEVLTASTELTLSAGSLVIEVSVTSAAGPFVLTLDVTQVTVDAIFSF